TGVYRVLVIDDNGCETRCFAVIEEPPSATCDLTPTNVSCNDESDGAIHVIWSEFTTQGHEPVDIYANNVLKASGIAAPPYDITGLPADAYTVRIEATIEGILVYTECPTTITEPDEVTVSIEATDANCQLDDGTITVTGKSPAGATLTITKDGGAPAPYNPAATYGPGYYVVTASIPGGNVGNPDCTASDDVTVGEISCPSETAFGFLDETSSTCFSVDGFSRWGWRTEFSPGDNYTMNLYMGGDCDSKGVPVGTVNITYIENAVTVTHDMDDDYALTSVHTYVGCDLYPMKGGNYTLAPGQYTYSSPTFGAADAKDGLTVSFETDGETVNVIAHVMANIYLNGSGSFTEPGDPIDFDYCELNLSSAKIATNVPVLLEPSDLKVYPNPFSDKVKFEFVSGKDARAVLEIHNILGQKVSTLMDQQVKQGVMNSVEYEPTHAVSGIYIYKLSLNGNSQIGRIIYKKE
ncbi:MAG: T9SS type A sorting domain-containing protein, partial [Bacteroidetes bacterium]|nr:T9SS type A sorting domain-containing protein [Bacteroidota bacterium]